MTDSNEKNFFDMGYEVKYGEVEIGNTYPIYGMITSILNDTIGDVEVMINYNIKAKLLIQDLEKLELLKQRAFEPGIFVSLITAKTENVISADVTTIVFGKRQENVC